MIAPLLVFACFLSKESYLYATVSRVDRHKSEILNINDDYKKYSRDIDENIYYSQILPFATEWKKTFNNTKFSEVPSPIHFWLKCVDTEIRGYFFIEDNRKAPRHGKEASMGIAFAFPHHAKLYVDDKQVKYGIYVGGGDFTADISYRQRNGTVNIYIEDWMHYTVFSLSNCIQSESYINTHDTSTTSESPHNSDFVATTPKYIMNLYTRYFDNPHRLNKKTVDGIINHFLYHRCALGLTHYELNIQKEQIPYFMQNPIIADAARNGWITFIIKNAAVPSPIRNSGQHGSNCYWQQIAQNLGILRYWKQNVRIYLWDGDEYMIYASNLTKSKFQEVVNANPVLAFNRYMAFCLDCGNTGHEGELKYLSFSEGIIKKSEPLRDPKLLVHPDKSGCFIIHWSGCGAPTHHIDESMAFIAHFENMFQMRFRKSREELSRGESLNENYKVMKYCDPIVLRQSYTSVGANVEHTGAIRYYFP